MNLYRRGINTSKKSEHKTEVQSGHFMVSEIDDTESETEDDKSIHDDSAMDSDQAFHHSGKNAVSEDLSSLFKYLKIAYSSKITCPRWNTFPGLRIHRRNVIRLNNYIWRGYHMQLQNYRGQTSKVWTTSIDNLIGPSTFLHYQKDDLLNFAMQNDLGDCTFSPSTLDEIMMDFEENFDIFFEQQNGIEQPSFVPVQPRDPLHEDIMAWNSHVSSAFTRQTPNKRVLSDQSMHTSLKERFHESQKVETPPTAAIKNLHQPLTRTVTFNSSETHTSALPFIQQSLLNNECQFNSSPLSGPVKVECENNQRLNREGIEKLKIHVNTSGVVNANQTGYYPSFHFKQHGSSAAIQYGYDEQKNSNTFVGAHNNPHFSSSLRESSAAKYDTKLIETKESSAIPAENHRSTAPLLCSVLTTPMLPVVGNLCQTMINYPNSMQQSHLYSCPTDRSINSVSAQKMTRSYAMNASRYLADFNSVRAEKILKKTGEIDNRLAWSNLSYGKQNASSMVSFNQPVSEEQFLPLTTNQDRSIPVLAAPSANDLTGNSSYTQQKSATSLLYDRTPDTNTYSVEMNQRGPLAEWGDIPPTPLVQSQASNMFRTEDVSRYNALSTGPFGSASHHRYGFGGMTNQPPKCLDDQAHFMPAAETTNSKMFVLPYREDFQVPFRQRTNWETQGISTTYPVATECVVSAGRYADRTNVCFKCNSVPLPPGDVQKSSQPIEKRMLSETPSASVEFDSGTQAGLPHISGVSMDVQKTGGAAAFTHRGRCSSTNNLFTMPPRDGNNDFIASRNVVSVSSERNLTDGRIAVEQPPSTFYSNNEDTVDTAPLQKQQLPPQNLLKQNSVLTASDTGFNFNISLPSAPPSELNPDMLPSNEIGNSREPCQSPSLLSEENRNLSNPTCLQILRDLIRIHRTLDRSTGSTRDSRVVIHRSAQKSTGHDVSTGKSRLLSDTPMSSDSTYPADGDLVSNSSLGRRSKAATLHNAADCIAQLQEECDAGESSCKSRRVEIANLINSTVTIFEKCSSPENNATTGDSTQFANLPDLADVLNPVPNSPSQPSSLSFPSSLNIPLSMSSHITAVEPPDVISPSSVTGLCSQLPEPARDWFQAYVDERTAANWKFYVFSLVIEKLFQSYWMSVNTTSKEHFVRSLFGWLYQHCSLAQLRPGYSLYPYARLLSMIRTSVSPTSTYNPQAGLEPFADGSYVTDPLD